jgi:methylmalonyl-CoA mutase N-terminal domain/subunit
LSGTIQNDILKEFIAQKEYIFPPRPSMRLVTDVFVQRPARTAVEHDFRQRVSHPRGRCDGRPGLRSRCAMASVRAVGVDAGLRVDEFVPRISFFFNAHSDFFEEIAKYRAARKIWAEAMRTRFGARDERSLKLRFHSQTAGVADRAAALQQRRPDRAPGAVGGPRRHQLAAHQLARRSAGIADRSCRHAALRTQQVLAYESGVTDAVDPFGGSYFVEALTSQMEAAALAYFDQIDRMGGMVDAIEQGFPQKEIAESSYRFQQAFERKEKVVVGVNDFVQEDDAPIDTLYIDDTASTIQLEKLETLRRTRDNPRVSRALDALRQTAGTPDNLMPAILEAVRAYATSAKCAMRCAPHGANTWKCRSYDACGSGSGSASQRLQARAQV